MPDEHTTYSDPPAAPPPPAGAGSRMRELRLAASMPQTVLARKMTGLGFHWYQTTVVRIEAGKTDLNFSEATAIAGIFGVPLESLAAAAATS